MLKELKDFLLTVFNSIEYHDRGLGGMILPKTILLLPQEQIAYLIDVGLIKRHNYPKTAWCNNCDVVCEVESVNNEEFLICLECSNQEKINHTNSLRYFSGLSELSRFLQNILGLDDQVQIIEDSRLLFLGSKEKLKYYLFCGIYKNDSDNILKKRIKSPYPFILTLDNNHSIETKTYNTLDHLAFKNGKFTLTLPKIICQNSIAKLGGQKKAEKYSEVRIFIINEFNKEKELNLQKSLKGMCNTIADKIREKFCDNLYQSKKPKDKKGHWWLKYDNLEGFVGSTIRDYKKNN